MTVQCRVLASFGSHIVAQVLKCVMLPFFVMPEGGNSARFFRQASAREASPLSGKVLPVLPSHFLWALSLPPLLTGAVWERGFRCSEGGNAVRFSDRIFSGVHPLFFDRVLLVLSPVF